MLKDADNEEINQSDSYWRGHIDSHKKSGESVKSYCLKHDLTYNQLSYRIQKSRSKKKRAQATLIPVSVKSSPVEREAVCRIDLKNGHSLSIYQAGVLNEILVSLL